MLALLSLLLPLVPAASTCITNYGKVACGYHCLAAHGEVGCARTSAGICGTTDRHLVCWDPPDSVRAHYGDNVPRPQCVTRSGEIACGYRCEGRDSGEVQCAATPDGICVATSRGITCWDPPVAAYCADDRPLPRPKCITVDGYAACGYGCAARNGELACALTPGGSCQVLHNQIICRDLEPPPMCGSVPCRPDSAASARWWCRPPPAPAPSPPVSY